MSLHDALRALVADWRQRAREEARDRDPGWVGAESAFGVCADDLEWLLKNDSPDPPDADRLAAKEKINEIIKTIDSVIDGLTETLRAVDELARRRD